jgi:uroporphyrinogen decarboxylase
MSKLSGAERIFKTMRHEEPDMVPTFENDIHINVIRAIKPGLDYVGFCEYMDLDAVVYFDMKATRWEVLDEARGLRRSEWGNISAFTGAAQYNPVLREPAIKSEKDLDNFVLPDPDRPDRFAEIEEGVRRFKGEKAVIATVLDPFRILTNSLRGEAELFRDMIKNPDLVERMNEIARNYALRYVKNCIEVGVDIIFNTGDYAVTQAPFVSREMTERFIIPGLRQLVDLTHLHGLPFLEHSDGNIMPILDLMMETGIDGLHPIDPVAGMDLGDMKSGYGDKTCLLGNVDCGNLLSYGTKDEVRQAVKKCIRQAGRGGGYICMSSNTIHGAVNPENYVEMIKAIREYGQYPLSENETH